MPKKKQRTYKGDIPHYETISEYPEYWKLIEWLATPTPMRKPATLTELAKELGVHNTTLSRWRAIPGCYQDVRERVKKASQDELPNIIYALKNKIYKEGNAKEIKLYLQWADEFAERHKIETTGDVKSDSPEVKKIISDFETKLKDILFKKDE